MSTHLSIPELITLLRKSVKELDDARHGLTDHEFSTLFEQDEYFRKNIALELKDIQTVLGYIAHKGTIRSSPSTVV